MSKRHQFGMGVLLAVVLVAGGVLAGDLTPPGPPGATMRTLQEIYDKQVDTFLAVTGDSNVVNTTSGDALAGELLNGKTAWVKGQAITGTMPNQGDLNVTPTTTEHTVSPGYYTGGMIAGDTDLAAGNIKSGVTIFDVAGTVVESTGDATAAQVLNGATFSKAGEAGLTGTMPNIGQTNMIPGTLVLTIPQGYHNGTGEVAGDADLVAGNIKKDVTIFGVTGTFEGGGGGTYSAAVPKTGQTTSYATGDDGDLENGVAWPNPRFTDNSNGTVTDNLTGLIWLKNANVFGGRTWATALTDCPTLNSGEAGLTDGSVEGDWRLPNVRELQSLIDYGRALPALPSGHPFTGVQLHYYWSSSTLAGYTDYAFFVYLPSGGVDGGYKLNTYYVWPVRGGQ